MTNDFRKHAVAGSLAIALAASAFAQGLPAPPANPQVAAPTAACGDFNVAIYFPAYETSLSPQSERVIGAASEQLKGCYVSGVSVNVLSEEAHTDEDAASLSEARADTVISALLAHGVEPASYKADMTRVEAAAAGAVPTVEPMARRVSVSFDVSPGYGA